VVDLVVVEAQVVPAEIVMESDHRVNDAVQSETRIPSIYLTRKHYS
jgi:hypothetical protein